MTEKPDDLVEFDEVIALALAAVTSGLEPRPGVRARIMARITETAATPAGFALRFDADDDWLPHPVPGIRKRIGIDQNRGA
jgi:hypothetical protein